MTRQFFLLLKVQLCNAMHMDRWREKNSGKRLRFAGLGILYLAVAALLLWYCYMIAFGLGAVGLARLIPLYAMTLGSLVTVFFTFLKAGGMLFGCRDYDLLAALPVPTGVLIGSRFAVMYLFNTVFSAGVMAAMGAAYLPYAKGALSWGFWILGALLASLIPTTLASVAAALVAAIASRFRYSNLVTILLSLALTFGVLGLSMQAGSLEGELSAASIKAVGDHMAGILTRLYPPAAWFGRAVHEGSPAAFGAFAGVSAVLYLLFAVVLSRFYQSIQNGLVGHGASKSYRMGRLKGRCALMALYQKEWKAFLSSPTYVLNMGIGVLMAVGASAALCFLGPESLMGMTNVPGLENYFSRILLYIPVVILPMGNTACVSLSLEGKQLWLLQSSPVRLTDVFLSKILVNLTLGLPGAVLCSIFLWIGTGPAAADGLVMLLLAVLVVCMVSVGGVWMNLRFPLYEWESQAQVVKRSASSMGGILGGLATGVGLAAAAVKLSELPLWMIGGVECAVTAAATLALWGSLRRVKRL